MRYIGVLFVLLLLEFSSYGQIENVIVETYYISDANDATDTLGGHLEPGSKTYRIYIDLKAGSRIKKIYGDANHLLRFSSTDYFFNNKADGQTFGKEFTKSRLQENTVALDTWITLGQASRVSTKTYFGVPKQYDNDGSIIGGVNNDGGSFAVPGGLLVNTNVNAGLPLTSSDGLMPGTNIPSLWADYGIIDLNTGLDTTIFGSLNRSNEFISNNAGLQNSGVEGVSPDTNLVLVAQLTTKGDISFEINLEVEQTIGGVTEIVNYVANDSVLLPNERLCAFLKYPAACGCRDPRYIEYNNSYTCDNADSCQNLVVYGCMDTMACNYDPTVNFNLPEMCCYPGYCNDRDIMVICPGLSSNRIRLENSLIYPNPALDNISIELTDEIERNSQYKIYNQLGKLVLNGRMDLKVNRIDISMLNQGAYMIQLLSANEIVNRVFIKEK